MDYTYILYFFHKLNHDDIHKVKFMVAVFGISLIQLFSELIKLPRFVVSLKDVMLILAFLVVYVKNKSRTSFLNAFIIDVLFFFLLTLCVTIANILSIDLKLTMVFGAYRTIFTIIIKIAIIIMMYLIISQIEKVEVYSNKKVLLSSSISLGICGIVASYILQLSEENRNQLLVMIILELVALFLFCFVIFYNMMIKKNYEAIMFQQMIEMTEKNIDKIAQEQKKIQQVIHDSKNTLLEVDEMITQGKVDQIHSYINDSLKNSMYTYESPLCLNVYIDSILREKIRLYSEIQFDLTLQIPERIPIKTTDLIALVSMVIDKSCNQIQKENGTFYHLELIGNEHELSINECFFTQQIEVDMRFSRESYLMALIKKYDGDIILSTQGNEFQQSIMLFYN